MKFFFLSLMSLLLAGCGKTVSMNKDFAGAPLPVAPLKTVTLTWDYPESELNTDLTFKIYNTTNVSLPITNWEVLHVIGTQCWTRFPAGSDARFFVITASNAFGESDFGGGSP